MPHRTHYRIKSERDQQVSHSVAPIPFQQNHVLMEAGLILTRSVVCRESASIFLPVSASSWDSGIVLRRLILIYFINGNSACWCWNRTHHQRSTLICGADLLLTAISPYRSRASTHYCPMVCSFNLLLAEVSNNSYTHVGPVPLPRMPVAHRHRRSRSISAITCTAPDLNICPARSDVGCSSAADIYY